MHSEKEQVNNSKYPNFVLHMVPENIISKINLNICSHLIFILWL